jgi:Uma2 family endonuclease
MPLRQSSERYTYEDWLLWDEDVRAEIIDGELYMMATPSIEHQRINREMSAQLYNFLRGKTCEVLYAPVGVRLPAYEDTVLEPDIIVVYDPAKLEGHVCHGAPDFIVEILSPSNVQHDLIIKFDLYRRSGVREYWIVDPEAKTVQGFVLQGGMYVAHMYDGNASASVTVLPGCEINLSDVFTQ